MEVTQKGVVKNPAKGLQCPEDITSDNIEEVGIWEEVNLGDISDAEEVEVL